jgi:altronate dehydratase small subunit
MGSRSKAIVINEKDNVATALSPLASGARVRVEVQGAAESIALVSSIPVGHKFSLKDIRKGQPVIKYGEPIGEAAADIRKGEHVHVHNVVSRPRTGGGGE